jgi:hypothetical protein
VATTIIIEVVIAVTEVAMASEQEDLIAVLWLLPGYQYPVYVQKIWGRSTNIYVKRHNT